MAVDMVEVGIPTWICILCMQWGYALSRRTATIEAFSWWLTVMPYVMLMAFMFIMLHVAEENILKTLDKFGFNIETVPDMKVRRATFLAQLSCHYLTINEFVSL
jgi:hypothetical protein